MRCFYHGDIEAVAVCKSCGHAVCHDCCAEVGTSAACRNRCESDVASLNALIARNKTVFRENRGIFRRNAWLFLILGLGFGGGAIFISSNGGGWSGLSLACPAAFFVLFAVLQFFNARRFADK